MNRRWLSQLIHDWWGMHLQIAACSKCLPMREALRLPMQGGHLHYQGPLIVLVGSERQESGWWGLLSAAEVEGEELVLWEC